MMRYLSLFTLFISILLFPTEQLFSFGIFGTGTHEDITGDSLSDITATINNSGPKVLSFHSEAIEQIVNAVKYFIEISSMIIYSKYMTFEQDALFPKFYEITGFTRIT